MEYSKLCNVYEKLENTAKGLEKTEIIAEFLGNITNHPEYIYLLQGNVFADHDTRELGMSQQLVVRVIAQFSGISDKEVVELFKEHGDLGIVAAEVARKQKQQQALFSAKLSIEKVLQNLRDITRLEGQGSIERKIGYVVELLHSASPIEAKYLIRTVLGDLKVGVGSGLLRDGIVVHCFKPEDLEEKKKYALEVQEAYDKSTDMKEVFEKACLKKLDKITLVPGRPVKVMLFPKAENVEDAFDVVGRPAAFEYKYDGFRVMVNKGTDGKIRVFTRRLEEVTRQFPDIIACVETQVKANSFMIDCEVVGYDAKTKKYTAFQDISQRIRRKYGIERMAREIPIELIVFDIIYHEGKSLIEEPFEKRRKLIEKIVKEKEYTIMCAKQIITEEEKAVETFYQAALEEGQEGLMGKNLTAPYKPGARVGYAVKLKPEDHDFDLVITRAEWGTGKRAGWLTSFDVSCKDGDDLLEVGKVSTGLKEKASEGLSFEEMTKLLEPLITEVEGRTVEVRAEIVVSVKYQNIQKSPTYNSGYALRFPRIVRLRPDRGVDDIARLSEVEKEVS